MRKILLVEPGPESRLVVSLQHALAMDLEHTTRGEAAEKGLPHGAGSTPAFRASGEGLADPRQSSADGNLVADLANLPGPGSSPIWTIRSGCPCTSSSGLHVRTPWSPPTMIEREALMAPISPPLTGASSSDSLSRKPATQGGGSAIGEMLLMSTMTLGWSP